MQVDGDVDVDQVGRRAGAIRCTSSRWHGDRPRRQLDRLAGAHAVVGAPAVDLDRAHRRGHLLQRAGLRGRAPPGSRRRPGRGRRRRASSTSPSRSSVTVRLPEPDRGLVGLVVPADVAEQPGGRADAEDQQAGGHRVERAGVPDLADRQHPPGPGDDVVRRHAAGLVDQQQTGRDVGVGTVGDSRRSPSQAPLSQRSPATRTSDADQPQRDEQAQPGPDPGQPPAERQRPAATAAGSRPAADPIVTVRR